MTERNKYQDRPVFAKWLEDTPETLAAMLAHDRNHWHLKQLTDTPQDYSHLEALIVTEFPVLTDIYHYLQTKSKRYPWLDFYTVRKHFFKSDSMPADLRRDIFDLSIAEADFDS